MIVMESLTVLKDRHFYIAGFSISSSRESIQVVLASVDRMLREYEDIVHVPVRVIRLFPDSQQFDVREEVYGTYCLVEVMSDRISVVNTVVTLVINRFGSDLEWMFTVRQ